MIIMHYNGFINIEKLREMTKTTKNGTTAYNLIETSKKLGFKSYGMKYDLSSSFNITLPAIAHVIIDKSYSHFVVVLKIDKSNKTILIADPANKIKKLSFNQFNNIYTKNMLIFYPIKPIVKEKEIKIIDFIKSMINKKYILIIIVTILSMIMSLISLLLIRQILNYHTIKIIVITLLIIILKYIINTLKDKLIIEYNGKLYYKVLNESFVDILSLPYMYYRSRTTGEIVSRINDIDILKDLLNISLLIITDAIITILTGIILYLTNHLLFYISLSMILLYFINFAFYNKKIKNEIEEIKQNKSLLNSYMVETITGFESIKGQNLSVPVEQKFKIKSKEYLSSFKKFEKIKANMYNQKQLINDMSTFLIIGIGTLLISKNLLSFSEFMLFFATLNYFFAPIENLTEISISLQDIKSSLKRIIELKYNKTNDKKIESGNIIFKNVNFNYNDRKILSDLNLNIDEHDKIMLLGSSGNGKSTILKILKQYYQAENIYINSKKLSDIDFNSQISYISQNEYLFTDTLLNNITMYRKISKQQLKKIIEICELKEVIKKCPLGLYTLIEENGFNLSGGEKQRIILARALIGNYKYLFIDEGLSEIDISLERKIIKNILKNFKNKTIIFVSHRTDNMDLFNKVIRLEKNIEVLKRNQGGIGCLEKSYG